MEEKAKFKIIYSTQKMQMIFGTTYQQRLKTKLSIILPKPSL